MSIVVSYVVMVQEVLAVHSASQGQRSSEDLRRETEEEKFEWGKMNNKDSHEKGQRQLTFSFSFLSIFRPRSLGDGIEAQPSLAIRHR